MKANELRIGNYVTHDDYSGEIFKVITIAPNPEVANSYVIDTKGGKNGRWINDILLVNPIPLTEEWLLKFGFKEFKYRPSRVWKSRYIINQVHFDPFIIHKSYGGLLTNRWVRLESLDLLSRQNLEIKYVHQLQNLYFALTGKELEILQ